MFERPQPLHVQSWKPFGLLALALTLPVVLVCGTLRRRPGPYVGTKWEVTAFLIEVVLVPVLVIGFPVVGVRWFWNSRFLLWMHGLTLYLASVCTASLLWMQVEGEVRGLFTLDGIFWIPLVVGAVFVALGVMAWSSLSYRHAE